MTKITKMANSEVINIKNDERGVAKYAIGTIATFLFNRIMVVISQKTLSGNRPSGEKNKDNIKEIK